MVMSALPPKADIHFVVDFSAQNFSVAATAKSVAQSKIEPVSTLHLHKTGIF
jgi:hypothetical protein